MKWNNIPPAIHTWRARYNAKKTLPGAFSLFLPSWRAFRRNWETFAEIVAVPFVVLVVGCAIVLMSHGSVARLFVMLAGTLVLLAGLVFALAAGPAFTYTQLRSAQGATVPYSEAFTAGLHYFWRMLLLSIMVGVLVLGGFILLIVPGLFMLRRYILAPYFLIDQDLSARAAMRASAEQSVQYSPAVWSLIGTQYCIVLPDILLPILGAVVTVVAGTMYVCAPALRYEEIKVAEAARLARKQVRDEAKKTQRRSKKKR